MLHALCGAAALGLFIVPLLSRKGGKLHVNAGRAYTYAMIVVGSSAFIITPWRAFFDQDRTPSTQGFALFLFFIAVFTLSALNYGLMAI